MESLVKVKAQNHCLARPCLRRKIVSSMIGMKYDKDSIVDSQEDITNYFEDKKQEVKTLTANLTINW